MFISVDLPAPFSPKRAWISPRRTVSAMSSFASVPVWNRFVIPRISRTGGASLIGSSNEERADRLAGPLDVMRWRVPLRDGLELPGLHVRDRLLDLVFESGRHGTQVADRRDANAVVDEVAGLLALVLETFDPVADRVLQALLSARDDAVLHVREREVLVHVDADAPDLPVSRGPERAGAGEPGDLEHHVDALADHRLGRGLPLVGCVEVLGVVHHDLHVRLHRLGAVLVALDVVDDRRHVRTSSDRADLAALGDRPADDAGEIARLGLVEKEALVVRRSGVRDELINAEELDARVRLRSGERVRTYEETDGHDHVVLLVHEALDVLLVVGDVLGDDVLCLTADGAGAVLYALPRELVERFVLELPDVRDHADLEAATATAGCGTAACDGDETDDDAQRD